MNPVEEETLAALRAASWSQTAAAKALGLTAAAVHSRIHRSPELAAVYAAEATRGRRTGRPLRQHTASLAAVKAALARHATAKAAAQDLGMSPQGVSAWMSRFPELRAILEESKLRAQQARAEAARAAVSS